MSQRPFAWEKHYPPGLAWDAPLDITTIGAMFDKAVGDYGERPVIEFRGKHILYRELGAKAEAAASAFLSLGHGQDRPIALYLPNVPYHPIAFFGGAKAGATLVHLSPLDAERELEHKLTDSGARTIVTTNFPTMLPNALKMLDRGLVDRVIVGDDAEWGESPIPLVPIPEREGVVSFSRLMADAPQRSSWASVTPDDIVLLQYTGGTTGKPRAAIISHANLTATISIYDIWAKAAGAAQADITMPDIETVIGVLPFFHIYALTSVLLRHVRNGNLILLRVRFDGDQVAARHRGQPGDVVPGRADHVDCAREPSRHRPARPVLAHLLRLRRRTAAGRDRDPLPADHRAAARRRMGHDRDHARRHQRSRLYGRLRRARSACRCRRWRWTSPRWTTRRACCRPARRARSACAART